MSRTPPSQPDSFSFIPVGCLRSPDSTLLNPATATPSHGKEEGRIGAMPQLAAEQAPAPRQVLFDSTAIQQPRPVPVPYAAPPHDGGGGTDLSDAMRAFSLRIRETSLLTLLWVALLVLALMTGNAMILICVNFWLDQFPESGRYTVFAFSGIVFSLFFLTALGLYLVIRRPDLSFLRHALSWKLLLWIGLMDTLNSGLAIYAAPGTPEVLQALFASLVPVYAAAFTKVMLKDPRQYCNRYVLVSFSLIIVGVMIASFFYLGGDSDSTSTSAQSSSHKAREFLQLIPFIRRALPACASGTPGGDSGSLSSWSSFRLSSSSSSSSADAAPPQKHSYDTILWSIIYFVSVIPTVLMNGGQTLFMTRYTFEEDFAADAQRILARNSNDGGAGDEGEDEAHSSALGDTPQSTAAAAAAAALATGDATVFHPFHASDTTVKLVMLAGGTTIQSLLTVLLFPMDALPWFGSSASVGDSWANFKAGVDCIFHCPNNLMFCVLYCMGFVTVYVSAAYLNQYSVTLCSMVTQLAAPCTAIVLVIFPVLNPSHDPTPWYVSTISACILGLGTFLYVVWDEQTGEEKRMGEVRLKMGMLGLLEEGDRGASYETIRTDAHNRPVEYVLVQSQEYDA